MHFVSDRTAKNVANQLLETLEAQLPTIETFRGRVRQVLKVTKGDTLKRILAVSKQIYPRLYYQVTKIDGKDGGHYVINGVMSVERTEKGWLLHAHDLLVACYRRLPMSAARITFSYPKLSFAGHALERFYQRAHTLRIEDLYVAIARSANLAELILTALDLGIKPRQFVLPVTGGSFLATVEYDSEDKPPLVLCKTFVPDGKERIDAVKQAVENIYESIVVSKGATSERVINQNFITMTPMIRQLFIDQPWLLEPHVPQD